jgi:hypothetical protein
LPFLRPTSPFLETWPSRPSSSSTQSSVDFDLLADIRGIEKVLPAVMTDKSTTSRLLSQHDEHPTKDHVVHDPLITQALAPTEFISPGVPCATDSGVRVCPLEYNEIVTDKVEGYSNEEDGSNMAIEVDGSKPIQLNDDHADYSPLLPQDPRGQTEHTSQVPTPTPPRLFYSSLLGTIYTERLPRTGISADHTHSVPIDNDPLSWKPMRSTRSKFAAYCGGLEHHLVRLSRRMKNKVSVATTWCKWAARS